MHPNAHVQVAQDTYIVFSCHQPAFLADMLTANNIGWEEAKGCYKGEHEVCFIVNQKHLDKIWFVLRGDQESILLLGEAQKNGARKAKLLYLDGRKEDYGLFMPIDENELDKYEGWTYREDQNQYYTCIV